MFRNHKIYEDLTTQKQDLLSEELANVSSGNLSFGFGDDDIRQHPEHQC